MAQGEAGLQAIDAIGLDTNRLARLTRETDAAAHRLPNGLTVWLAARSHSRDGAPRLIRLGRPADADVAPSLPCLPRPSPPSLPPPPSLAMAPSPLASATGTLRDSDRYLVSHTVQTCGGNVSKAARALGVSRGLVYRHLKRVKPTVPALAG